MKFHTVSKQMKLKTPHLRKTPPLVSGKIFAMFSPIMQAKNLRARPRRNEIGKPSAENEANRATNSP